MERVTQFYNTHALAYDRHMRTTRHYAAQQKLLTKLSADIQEPIIDVACGSGFILDCLSPQFDTVCGNDTSLAMPKLAKQK